MQGKVPLTVDIMLAKSAISMNYHEFLRLILRIKKTEGKWRAYRFKVWKNNFDKDLSFDGQEYSIRNTCTVL